MQKIEVEIQFFLHQPNKHAEKNLNFTNYEFRKGQYAFYPHEIIRTVFGIMIALLFFKLAFSLAKIAKCEVQTNK